MVDTAIVGQFVGVQALAAVGSTGGLIFLVQGFVNGLTHGFSVIVSQRYGANDEEGIKKATATSIYLSAIATVVLTIICVLGAKSILQLMNTPADIMDEASLYVIIFFGGLVATIVFNLLASLLRAFGDSKTPLYFLILASITNIVLDLILIINFKMGVAGAAIATVLSQFLSAAYVLLFLEKRAEMKARLLKKTELKSCKENAKNIVSLGTAGFIMQLTNSLVTICCNNVLGVTGGDVYISVMTIVSSVRQMVETPIYAINEGTSPILSYNYGAKRPKLVRKAMVTLAVMVLVYTAVMWNVIIFVPDYLIAIFSSDKLLIKDAVPALKTYFAAFIFMDLQYIGQTVFKSLNKKKQAIFFSLLRKVFIVVPLTYLLPYVFKMGTHGVFLAEPVSNVIGGSLCFVTMLLTILPELKRMEKKNGEADRPMEYFKTR